MSAGRDIAFDLCRRRWTLHAGGASPAMMGRVAGHIGRYAQARRKACNLRQTDLAQHLGVSRQWIIAMEKGGPGLDLDMVLRAYEELGLGLMLTTLHDRTPEWAEDLHRMAALERRPARSPRTRRSRATLDRLRALEERYAKPPAVRSDVPEA